MINYFISTGCSFTEVPMKEFHKDTYVNTDAYPHYAFSWPVHVNNILKSKPCYKGKGGSGNGIISRTTIYEVNKALRTYKPEELLVGIMWSGAYRHEIYSSNMHNSYHAIDNNVKNQNNPASIGRGYKYYKVMPYWDDELSKMYYKNIYDEVGSYIETIEHILRVQWFLKNHNIKYFMTTYFPEVFPKDKNHEDIKYLYDMIDFDNFLDVDSEYEWCARYQNPKTWDDHGHAHPHPHTKQHKAFAEQVIIPHLQKKGYI
jgi:hypothetical protein